MKDYNLENLAPQKQGMQTNAMKVPAFFFVSGEASPKEKMLKQIENISSRQDIFQHIAVLSDAHPKPGIENPTGSVVATENKIIPEMLDAAPNCGMRVILTDLNKAEMTEEKIEKLFENLRENIPSKKLIGTKISPETVTEIFRNGSAALKNIFELRTKKEFENTYKNGNFFAVDNIPSVETLQASLPSAISWIGKFRLGLLGATNSHFLCLMRVAEIEDYQLAQALNIRKGQYVFFLHTGSSIVGRYAASLYTERKIKSLSQKIILYIIRALSNLGVEKSETVFRAVSNYGFANRTLITHKLDQALEQAFGRQISVELLYDAPHVYFDHESHFGTEVVVHRNGANRAYGPQKMTGHSVFEKTGEPVLIASFNDKFGYIGVGTDQNTETFFSANHEIGKIKEIGSDQNSDAYAVKIMAGLKDNKIINPVAKLEMLKKLTY